MPPSFIVRRHVYGLLAFQLRALEDTVPFLVELEAKSLLLVSLKLLSGQSSNDSVKVNSANVWRISAMASMSSSATTTST
jgi:hypothetical protein